MAKKNAAKRGATPVAPKKARKQWRLPKLKIPAYFWSGLLAVCVLSMLCFGGYWSYQQWRIEQIVVNGRLQVLQANHLTQQVAWVKGKNFIGLDVDAVYQELQKLPLVTQLTVRKKWPDTLVIDVVEDIPVALWNGNKLLSASGRLSEIPAGVDIQNLIKIHGPEQQVEQAARYYRRVQQTLNELNIYIVDLTVTAVDSIQIKLSNDWQVELGRQYLDERILRLKQIIQTFPADKISTVDLRYGKGAAIRWRQQQEIS